MEQEPKAGEITDYALSLIYHIASEHGIVVVGRARADIIRTWWSIWVEGPTEAQIAAVLEHGGFCGDHLNDLMLDATRPELERAVEEVWRDTETNN